MSANIENIFRYILLLIAIGLTPFISCAQKSDEINMIRGIYGNPKPFWDKDVNLNDLGVNAIFIRSGSIRQDIMNRARAEGLMVFAEFATLNGKNYVDEHPQAWPINMSGEKVEPASWFMGVCPTEPGFRRYRLDLLRDLLLEFDLDGVWLDYVHWHAQFEEPEPILPETCFCDLCLGSFSKDFDIKIPDGTTSQKASWILNNHDNAWRDWRCKVIFDWTAEMKNLLTGIKPEALLGIYHCPWNDQEFDGARRRILGLDFDMLKETVDVFSPMVYHAKMGRDPEWVRENTNWLGDRLDTGSDPYPKIWPIVQAHDSPRIISSEEFEMVLRYGLSRRSGGVMMFTSNAVAEDENKTAVMKKVYTSLMKRTR